MKPNEEVMEILEAFDLTGSFRAAARLAGCDPKTVARYVALRGVGKELDTPARNSIAAPFLDKIEELVERSKGDVRADVVHEAHHPKLSPSSSPSGFPSSGRRSGLRPGRAIGQTSPTTCSRASERWRLTISAPRI